MPEKIISETEQSAPPPESLALIQRKSGFFTRFEQSTIPEDININGIRSTRTAEGQKIDVLTNFIKLEPIPNCLIYQYRVDFEPNVESITERRNLFRLVKAELFQTPCIYDDHFDARSKTKLLEQETTTTVKSIRRLNENIKITIKRVGTVTGSFEMIRLYNMHMRDFLRKRLGFFQVNQTGAYVHHNLATPIGQTNLIAFGGYRTAANVHENNVVLMNLESVHKLCQKENVYQYMDRLRRENPGKIRETLNDRLVGKLVVTSYNKNVYKIEEVIFDKNPMATFYHKKKDKDITFQEFYKSVYNLEVRDLRQPLLLVVPNNKRKRDTVDVRSKIINRKLKDKTSEGDDKQQEREDEEEDEKEEAAAAHKFCRDILLIPELCNITGLTNEQRNDNKLKNDLVRASQISPTQRVHNLNDFMQMFHSSVEIKKTLNDWGYSYGRDPIKVPARILPIEKIAVGERAQGPTSQWPTVQGHDAGFDHLIMKQKCAIIPNCKVLKIIIGRTDFHKQQQVLDNIKAGFVKVGLNCKKVDVIRMEGLDTAQNFTNNIRKLSKETSIAIVILPCQNKERYDAVKKAATAECGIVTQVVTSRLLCDERKARGASIKIGIQICAKLGGEPWWVHIPLKSSMVCGYDTYHDTAHRGRSFGAFVASMNSKYSQWWSKADEHDRIDELSSHIAENLVTALDKYKQKNDNKYPDRILIYRDGVADGQLNHVIGTELKQIELAVKRKNDSIKIAYIIVTKKAGARFYWKNGPNYLNCAPGTVIDDVVTRKERYDFYLVSQSTRQGTVAPTYYNIIQDETGLDAERQQRMAFKLCFLYYNWSGSTRVPAPCQYAHKLALLCGEHLHKVPNVALDEQLHFL